MRPIHLAMIGLCCFQLFGCTTDNSVSGVSTTQILSILGSLRQITVTPANASFAALTNQQFQASGSFADGTTLDLTPYVTWSSSNQNVTTIGTTTGVATGVAPGSAVISASLANITGSATATVGNASVFGDYSLRGTGWVGAFSTLAVDANVTFDGNGRITAGQLRREFADPAFGGVGVKTNAVTAGNYTLGANRTIKANFVTDVGTFVLDGTASRDAGQFLSGSLHGAGVVALVNGAKKITGATNASANGTFEVHWAQSYSGDVSGNLTLDGAGGITSGTLVHRTFGTSTTGTVTAGNYTVAADGTIDLSVTTDVFVASSNPLPLQGNIGADGSIVFNSPSTATSFPSPVGGVMAKKAASAALSDFTAGSIGVSLIISEPFLSGFNPIEGGVVSGTAQWDTNGNVTGGSLTYRDPASLFAVPATVTGGGFTFNANGTASGTVTFTYTHPLLGAQTATITVSPGNPGVVHAAKNAGTNVFNIPQPSGGATDGIGLGVLIP